MVNENEVDGIQKNNKKNLPNFYTLQKLTKTDYLNFEAKKVSNFL